jgi:hypothetical protein
MWQMWKRLFPTIARMEVEKRLVLIIVVIIAFGYIVEITGMAMMTLGLLPAHSVGWL